MINAAEPSNCYAPLDRQANPFTSNAPPPVSSAQTALEEVIRHIGLRRRAIIIAGGAGTGKTFLLKLIVRSCSDMGLSVRQFDRGDLADTTIDARFDVALVDEADSIPDSAVLTLLFPDPSNTATTWVFTCLPTSVDRLSCLDANVVELRGFSVDDAQTYLLERATSIGRPDLFAPDALNLIIHQARGSPRLLRSVASLAFFTAGWGRATQIGVRHVAYWLKSEISFEDDAAPHGGVFGSESANHTKAEHRSGNELAVYRSIPALKGDGPKVKALVLKPFPGDRALRLTRASAAITASIGLAGAVAAFLLGGNAASVGTSVTVPTVANLVAAEVRLGQTPPATPGSPDIDTSAAGDAVEPPSVNAPARKATAGLGSRDPNQVGQPGAAAKRTGPPTPMKTARTARAPKSSSSPAATKKAAQRARDAVHVARQAQEGARRTAEAAAQAQHAARQANEAARRADQAASRADQAASQAERAARQANWRIRIRFPWKAITESRSAS
jgi:hypothetical protein